MELNRYIKISLDLHTAPITTDGTTSLATQEDKILTSTSGYDNTHNDFHIVEGSVVLEEMLCDGALKLGQVCASKFEVEVFGMDNDVANSLIVVSVVENNVESPLFKGIVESSIADNYSHSRKIVAYDTFYYLRDINVADWWNAYWTNRQTSTLKDLRESLCSYMGFNNPNTQLPNDSMTFGKYNDFTSISFENMLRMICEAQACIPHISRNGEIEYKFFEVTDEFQLTNYEKNNAKFEDYVTKSITGINIYNSSDEFTFNYGTTSNAYIIAGNIFLMSLNTEELTNACNIIFNKLSGFYVVPCTVPMIVSDLSFTVGKRFDTVFGTHYIMSQTFSGSLLVDQELRCESDGEELDATAIDRNNDIIEGKKWSTIQQNVEGIRAEVSSAITTLDGKINDVSANITVTATSVAAQVLQDNEVLSSMTIKDAGVIISTKKADPLKQPTDLVLKSEGLYIVNTTGSAETPETKTVARFEADNVTLNHWTYAETLNGNCLNIYRRQD